MSGTSFRELWEQHREPSCGSAVASSKIFAASDFFMSLDPNAKPISVTFSEPLTNQLLPIPRAPNTF